jgi:hypothetical protein
MKKLLPLIMFTVLSVSSVFAQTAASSPSPAASPSPGKHKHKKTTAAATGSPGATASAGTPAPGGGPGLVWVNTKSHVYHKEGSKLYGRTKHGKYMSEADAIKEGDHPSKSD